jgi:hypothetical protein
MRLEDYPRPPDDNGRGVHWSASVYHPTGDKLDSWISELTAMKIKWVKLLDDGGGSSKEVCEKLLDAGIMPVVRLYRPQPNPGHIRGREEKTVRELVALGVRYFETNNEPDLAAEWQNNHRPSGWLDVVVDNFIYDADRILSLGGLPAFPAMGVGTRVNGIARVVERGRGDIFEKGAWVAIHNYTLNHPLDYPYDDVNQNGTPLTREEYERLGSWAWDGQPMETINEWREKDKNPGATIHDDSSCFLALKLMDEIIRDTLGFPVPILSTEGGPVVGWREDRRYPRITPQLHADMVAAITDYIQGTGTINGEIAPDSYFCMCHWILANYRLGFFAPSWESQSWYTDWWNETFDLHGELPVVARLKEMPSRSRVPEAGGWGIVSGIVRDRNRKPLSIALELRSGDETVATARSDEDGSYTFDKVKPGVYNLAAEWRGVVHPALVVEAGEATHVDLEGLPPSAHADLRGTVTDSGGAPVVGQEVVLSLESGGEVARSTTSDDGGYSILVKAQGDYVLSVGELRVPVRIGEEDQYTVNLVLPSPSTFIYRVVTKRLVPADENQGRSLFWGKVMDQNGNPLDGIRLEMRWQGAASGTSFPTAVTGTFVSRPRGYYEFLHSAGIFDLRVTQGDWESEVADGLDTAHAPGQEGQSVSYEVNFQLLPVSTPVVSNSQVVGDIPGCASQEVVLRKGDENWSVLLGDDCRFEFSGLGPGTYTLEIIGVGVVADSISLDGQNRVTLTFPLQGRITGTVKNARAGMKVTLHSNTFGWDRISHLDDDGAYAFDHLPRGMYAVEVADKSVTGITNDGVSTTTVPVIELAPPAPSKTITRYFLLGSSNSPYLRARLMLVLPYARKLGATVGFSTDEAKHAAEVIIVGGEDAVSPQVAQDLEDAGCKVQRLPGDLYGLEQFVDREVEG